MTYTKHERPYPKGKLPQPGTCRVEAGGFGCTGPKDHEGRHEAGIGGGEIAAEWD